MRKYVTTCIALLSLMGSGIARAATGISPTRAYRQAHELEILEEFKQFLATPNTANDLALVRKNADFILSMMERRGIHGQLLEATRGAGAPAVFGEIRSPGATRTILLYAHYDGQPAVASQWIGKDPWNPTLRCGSLDACADPVLSIRKGFIDPNWRIYARSASDDKLGVFSILTAIEAIRQTHGRLSSNIKLFFEGEEESGSPHLADIVIQHRDLLQSDGWIIIDGPAHQSGGKIVSFGVRGIATMEITTYGAVRPLHSGHYGNWAPNPAMIMAQLLASMKDRFGRVTVDGFYDDVAPMGEEERRAISSAPKIDHQIMSALGFSEPENPELGLIDSWTLPSLNIDGFQSGDVGAMARNVIPTTATATIDMRLVEGNDVRRQCQKVVDHIAKQGFYVTDREPTKDERASHRLIATAVCESGYNAERTAMDSPESHAILEAVQSVSEIPIVVLPTTGASLPLHIIREQLATPSITVSVANYDNNQHAENENVRIGNLWDGIEIVARIMQMK